MRRYDDPVIAARNLSLSFAVQGTGLKNILRRDSKTVNALSDVSLVIERGESVGILGRNGSGKSTLLSVISGQVSPDCGEVFTSSDPTLLSVSAALQNDVSGFTNARLGLLAKGLSRTESVKRAEAIREWCELGEAFERPIKTYSSGMRARLKFAIATEVASEILLVDEALSTGDATFAIKAKERMASFLSGSGAVVIVSHSASTIKKQCDRVIWIDGGEVVGDGHVDTIGKTYERWNRLRARGRVDEADRLMADIRETYEKPEIVLTPSTKLK